MGNSNPLKQNLDVPALRSRLNIKNFGALQAGRAKLVSLVTLCALLVGLLALPFIARTSAESVPPPSAGGSTNQYSSRYSWVGGDADVFNKIFVSRSARTLSPASPMFF